MSPPETDPFDYLGSDPFFEREKSKYPRPIPSREYILDTLEASGEPLLEEELVLRLKVPQEDREIFSRRLKAMLRDGQILKNRKGEIFVAKKLALLSGRVQGHPQGFGFLIRDDGGQDVFLSPRQMRLALHGDRALVRLTGTDRRGRPEGVIVEVLERANNTVVGRLASEHGVFYLEPEDQRLSQDILLPPGEILDAQEGDYVVAALVEQPGPGKRPVGRVVEVLGPADRPGIEVEVVVRKYKLPFVFPPEAIEEAHRLTEPGQEEISCRADLQDLPFVTIDGEDAKDFDDAVFAAREGNGFKLLVAIADVSRHVREKGALDKEARQRATSVYFPNAVIPMLPERLSNDLCSLVPGRARLVLVCEMDISCGGEVLGYRFYAGVIRSRARLTYTSVSQALADPNNRGEDLASLMPHLLALEAVFEALFAARTARGAIDFDTVETRFVFDEEGRHVKAIVPTSRTKAHRMIEEAMLAANASASDFLHKRRIPALFRVHAPPSPEKLEQLRGFLADFGLTLGGGLDPTASDYQKVLQAVDGRPDKPLFQTVLLRSMMQAVYQPENVGHFSLAYEAYTHFTSPIRRYPDLVVHRAIKSALDCTSCDPGDLEALGKHASTAERRADEASREVETWLKCKYMQDKAGEVFMGTITGVQAFGIFVTLHGVYAEGLVHISDVGRDYFRFDAIRHQLTGERTGERYVLGDTIRVQVARVDMTAKEIGLVLPKT